ncbi:MAG: choice-of-anchor J domain-containing protein [Rhodanobacteraceae bacterium]|nr:choice-of-anchor J domain-containing protein [Rhodanobacteraceae bacterium]
MGDVGPNHYVRMANASFQIFNKTGTSVFGPANINTLFTGFGGACETENAGDPIVLYDQLADRWLLTQFSDSAGPGFFNCVALSTTSDPLGTYHRWAFVTATFPDYPKYGVWPNAYLISTREVDASLIGAYAVDRTQMLAGNPSPSLVQFTVPVNQFSGDGLLPADIDGSNLPPPNSPAFYVGSMDNGGPYGATQDALSLWAFNINFVTPASSSFQVVATIPIAPYDTIFPCNGRSCIPQPAPLGAVDILSYRQRPMHRAAYRNYGSYQSIVTNQSVEAAPVMAGIRWWEIRNPGANAVLYQDSTYAPGITDGTHRWMGSIAQDSNGNMGLGYSAGSANLFPSVHYTGRLEGDPLNEMSQGEGIFVTGTGGHTAGTRRWGDYTSMTVDSTDDCTFWYVNEFFAVSGTQWTMRAGSFKFPECGNPTLGVAAVPLSRAVCAPDNAVYTVEGHGYKGFASSTNLSVSGVPAGATSNFSVNPINPVPGNSTLTIGNTAAATPGNYTLTITGTSASPAQTRSRTVGLQLFTAAPAAPTGLLPASGASGLGLGPTLSWTATAQSANYVVEVATDAAFTNIVYTSPATTATSVQVPTVLLAGTTYRWRVRGTNLCGPGTNSATSTFTTRFAPGTCGVGQAIQTGFSDNMENGVNGWTTDPVSGTTWTLSNARPSSGSFAWLAVDVVTASDQRLISPVINVPATGNAPTLRFRHDVSMEPNTAASCFDGGFVEVSTNGGSTWTVLDPATQLEDFYDGPLASGERAWCGIQPYTTASFDMAAYAGQSVRLRFRAITDTSVGNVPHGWYVDDVRIENCDISDTFFKNGFE